MPSRASRTLKPIAPSICLPISRTVSSSSTRSTVPMAARSSASSAAGSAAASREAAGRSTTGKSTRKVEPRPGSLSTRSPRGGRARCPSTAARPRPRPVNFVVKKGSKILALVSSVHAATGVGDLEIHVVSLAEAPAPRLVRVEILWSHSPRAGREASTMPPRRRRCASEALITRFMTTWRIWVASAWMAGRRSANS